MTHLRRLLPKPRSSSPVPVHLQGRGSKKKEKKVHGSVSRRDTGLLPRGLPLPVSRNGASVEVVQRQAGRGRGRLGTRRPGRRKRKSGNRKRTRVSRPQGVARASGGPSRGHFHSRAVLSQEWLCCHCHRLPPPVCVGPWAQLGPASGHRPLPGRLRRTLGLKQAQSAQSPPSTAPTPGLGAVPWVWPMWPCGCGAVVQACPGSPAPPARVAGGWAPVPLVSSESSGSQSPCREDRGPWAAS